MKSSKGRKNPVLTIVIAVVLLFGVLSFLRVSPFLFQLVFNHDIALKKSDNRISILLLGIGGGNHDGPNLTDTIIYASLDPDKNKVSLVSIPRDLWIQDINGKINSAYALGEDKKKGGGLVLAEALVSKILNQPVDYGVRIDFAGFVKAVDLVGGLDITVDRSFDDYEYPIEGKEDDACGHSNDELQNLATASSQLDAFPCRYKHIHFDKGLTHMDGETALEFVRSRHAVGDEGSDFARSARQQKVIVAFRQKVLSAETILNPTKVINLFNIVKGSIDTDIKEDEYDDFVRLSQKLKKAKIQSSVLDTGDDATGRPGLLINPPITSDFNFAWVLIPRNGATNFKEIQDYVACEIKIDNCQFFKKTTQ